MIRRWLSLLLCLCSLTLVFTTSAFAAPESIPTQSVATTSSIDTAIFAGGCFWCMEKPFDELPGVLDTTSGYIGGTVANPTYRQVSAGGTGHFEAVRVTYDPSQISYAELLAVFWQNVDPLDRRGQFCDQGSQYRSAIFYQNEAQAATARASKQTLATDRFQQDIATDIRPASPFYPAEDYHQNYYQTHPIRYRVYRFACGRDRRLTKLWGEDTARRVKGE